MKFMKDVVFKKYVNIEDVSKIEENYKSKLIEWCQKYQLDFIFDIVSERTLLDNNTTQFTSRVCIEGIYCGTGVGYSKKESHQDAAKHAYNHIKRDKTLANSLLEARDKRNAL